MSKQGRKSDAERLTLVPFVAPIIEPPDDLSASEAEIFRSVAACLPAGWFRADSMPLLVEYSRAVDACNYLATLRRTPNLPLHDLTSILAAHKKQARLAIN